MKKCKLQGRRQKVMVPMVVVEVEGRDEGAPIFKTCRRQTSSHRRSKNGKGEGVEETGRYETFVVIFNDSAFQEVISKIVENVEFLLQECEAEGLCTPDVIRRRQSCPPLCYGIRWTLYARSVEASSGLRLQYSRG